MFLFGLYGWTKHVSFLSDLFGQMFQTFFDTDLRTEFTDCSYSESSFLEVD